MEWICVGNVFVCGCGVDLLSIRKQSNIKYESTLDINWLYAYRIQNSVLRALSHNLCFCDKSWFGSDCNCVWDRHIQADDALSGAIGLLLPASLHQVGGFSITMEFREEVGLAKEQPKKRFNVDRKDAVNELTTYIKMRIHEEVFSKFSALRIQCHTKLRSPSCVESHSIDEKSSIMLAWACFTSMSSDDSDEFWFCCSDISFYVVSSCCYRKTCRYGRSVRQATECL